MEPREIPGYYYDPDKKKYFKVAKNAPATAAYSADSVKRRKLEQNQAQKAAKLHENRKKSIRRSKTLQNPLLGGFLTREHGIPRQDLLVDCWAKGLVTKGHVRLSRHGLSQSSAEHIYVGTADERSKLGVTVGSIDGRLLYGAYIPKDEHDRIVTDPSSPFWMQKGHSLAEVQQISSLKYHQPSKKLLVTSRDPGVSGGIYSLTFDATDPSFDPSSPPNWDLRTPRLIHLHNWSRQGKSQGRTANTCAPAPASSNLLCVVGTSRGLGCYSTTGHMHWIENASSIPPHLKAGRPPSSDVLSLDFQPQNPQTLIAGLRGSRRICLADLRQDGREWEWIVHRSSPAYVRCLSEHHVLAAGPGDSMSVYDLRFRHRETWRNHPLVTFPEYKNDEQVHFGIDVDVGLGVVAAANHAQATLGRGGGFSLFSLATGRKLEVPELWRDVVASAPPKAIIFQTMPGEANASLFVSGLGGTVRKFSFGGNVDEWTGERFDGVS